MVASPCVVTIRSKLVESTCWESWCEFFGDPGLQGRIGKKRDVHGFQIGGNVEPLNV